MKREGSLQPDFLVDINDIVVKKVEELIQEGADEEGHRGVKGHLPYEKKRDPEIDRASQCAAQKEYKESGMAPTLDHRLFGHGSGLTLPGDEKIGDTFFAFGFHGLLNPTRDKPLQPKAGQKDPSAKKQSPYFGRKGRKKP